MICGVSAVLDFYRTMTNTFQSKPTLFLEPCSFSVPVHLPTLPLPSHTPFVAASLYILFFFSSSFMTCFLRLGGNCSVSIFTEQTLKTGSSGPVLKDRCKQGNDKPFSAFARKTSPSQAGSFPPAGTFAVSSIERYMFLLPDWMCFFQNWLLQVFVE